MHVVLVLVQVLDEVDDAALGLEVHLVLVARPLVDQADTHAAGQERQFAKARRQRVERELRVSA